jgi:alkyl hydroperoxide reductase subunit AhpF
MPLFRPDEEHGVREHFARLERPVELALVLGPEEAPLPGSRELDYSAETRQLLEQLVALSDLLTLTVHEEPALGAERFPAIFVLPEGEDVGIRYYGLPWGYELTSIVGACVDAGRPGIALSEPSQAALAALERPLNVDVFVTPT